MYATTVRFSIAGDTDWEALRQALVRRAFDVFRDVPGLRSKAFVYSPERSEVGGNYVWMTQDDAEAYLRSDAFRAIVERLGEPRVEGTEICAYVEDGELLYPLGMGPSPRGASPAAPAQLS